MIKMSITNDEWNAGRTRGTIEAQILTFLTQNQRPFTFDAIMFGLGYNTKVNDLGTLALEVLEMIVVNKALEKLIGEGKVEAKVIETPTGKETYYKAVSSPGPACVLK